MANTYFLKDVNKAILDQVDLISKRYLKGASVHASGEICDSIDIVISGNLVAYALSQNGSESIVFEFAKDSVIGANLIFSNTNRYPLNIYCTDDCELLRINKSDIEKLLYDHQFTMSFIKSISLNSQGMNKKIAMYTQKSLKENLIDYLLALSLEQNSDTVNLPISKKQLADYFGVQRPSLFRELKHMSEEGLIDISNRSISIKRLTK